MHHRLLFLSLVALTACEPKGSPAPELTLAPAGDSILVPFAEVTDAAWLGADRWAVLAPGGPEADIVDFAGASRRTLRSSDSVNAQPYSLFRAGDTIYTGEPLGRRTALWTLDGRSVRLEPTSAAVRGALPRARDPGGSFLVELRPAAGPDGSGNRDSAVVVRLGGTVDTVGRLAPLDLAKVQSPSGERFEQRVFSGVDRWGVLHDGTVWLARVYHNRVDHRLPDGTTRKGHPLPDRVLEVTRADRERFVETFPKELRTTAEQLPFAPIKGAFTTAFADASARVWLERSRAISDTMQTYHVVGRDGRLSFIAVIPGDAQVIGASDTKALVADPGRDGVYLRQAPLPSLAPAN
jgi:hypothetical protein